MFCFFCNKKKGIRNGKWTNLHLRPLRNLTVCSLKINPRKRRNLCTYKQSMYVIFSYIYQKNQPNVGKAVIIYPLFVERLPKSYQLPRRKSTAAKKTHPSYARKIITPINGRQYISHTIHVWCIYLHLVDSMGM